MPASKRSTPDPKAKDGESRKARRGKRSLRSALLLVIFAPLMSLFIVCAIAIWHEWVTQREQTYGELLRTATAVSLAVDREVDRSKAILDTLAASRLIDAKDWRAFHELARAAISHEPYAFIALTEPSGTQPVRTMVPYGSSPPPNPFALGRAQAEAQWHGRPLPRSTQGLAQSVFETGRMASSGLYYGISIRKPAVSIATPVIRDGRVAFVLIKGSSVHELIKLLQAVDHKDAQIAVVDRDGRVIACNCKSEDAVGTQVSAPLVQALQSTRQGIREDIDFDGRPTVSAFRRSELTDWTVNASITRSVALARATEQVLVWAAIGIAFLAIGFLGARRFWQRVAPPLVAMGRSARAIQRGEDCAMPVSEIAEIDDLAALLREAAASERREQAEATRRTVAEESERATHQLVAALQQSEARFRTLVEQSATGIASVDMFTGRFVLVNQRLTEITGYSREELLERTYVDLTHPDDRVANTANMAELAQGSLDVYQAEKRYIRKDGSVRWVHIHVRRFPGSAEPMSFASIVDVTQRKEAELALRAADRRKDEFLATLAHELRNPLAPLRNGIEIWKLRGDDPATTARLRELMERQVTHMVRLIDDLLDVSRIATGRLELRQEAIDLAELVAAAAEAALPVVTGNGLKLEVTVENAPLTVDGDSTRLMQVLENLLTNASKYTEPPGHIAVRARRCDNTAVVTVTDTGIGIPADKLVSIFDMFSQIHGSRGSSKDRGLGIGLHIVKKLVELHGGSVVATSRGENRGSEFVITLPLLSVTPAVRLLKVVPHEPDSARRILVVDDNRDVALSLAALLEVLGHTVQTAFGGEEALACVAATRPEVMLLDIGMADIDGHEVARRVRAGDPAVQPFIIAVTGWGQPEDKKKTAAAGIDLHLVKPISRADLQRALESAASALLARRSGSSAPGKQASQPPRP